MKPSAPHSAICLKIFSGILFASLLAFAPALMFAQRGGAGGHAGVHTGGRPGVIRTPQAGQVPRAPVGRAPGAAGVNRPIIVNPAGPLRNPGTPFRVFFPPRPPRRFTNFPVSPIFVRPFFFGFGDTSTWFPSCNVFPGWGYGCGTLPPYYNGYGPQAGYSPLQPAILPEYSPQPNVYPPHGYLPADDFGVQAGVGGQLPRQILIYLKDGSVYAVASYTVSDGQLHYVTIYGGKSDIDLDRLDVQKTTDENASRGVTFTLTPPNPAPAAPGPISSPPP
jgi:hypothetical protein